MLLSLLWLGPQIAHADFSVLSGNANIDQGSIRINAELDLALGKDPSEALLSGIPLMLIVHAEIYKLRTKLWKHKIQSWEYPYLLNYHQLSGRFSIEDQLTGEMRTYGTLVDALNVLSVVHISEKMAIPIANDEHLYARLKVQLDKSNLPQPLNLISIFFRDWRNATDWHRWKIAH
ncbi:MAG: hypothetical protein CL398_12990 [Acidiferrobacteraceae bacterium]|nr:hypothetical protein [Acidiferrobacteraceae bacterium]